jgi:hypothetical protein
MPNRPSIETRLNQLLEESAALRERSIELAQEAARLKAEIEKDDAMERRKKPRAKGK